MSYSFKKNKVLDEHFSIDLYLDDQYTLSLRSKTEKDLNDLIDCLISKYPEHNKSFFVSRIIDYKVIYVKGENL